MHTVLGLSLNSNHVAWVLVDAADGTVLDLDALELQADAEIAGAAARGAHTIARACGFEVDRVRLTWSADVARDGLRLRTQLGCQGFSDVEAVPLACATAVSIDPDIAPGLALAYGAALAVVLPSEATTVPVVQLIPARSRLRRRRIVSTVLGVAAAAVLGVLCLSAGAAPQIEPEMATADAPIPSDAGWVTVPAPSDAAAAQVRKVVAVPSYAEQSTTVPPQTYVPVQAGVVTAPEATPEPIAEPTPVSAELPHLSGAQHAVGPVSGPADLVSAPAAEPDMTEFTNVFSALP